MYHLTRWKPCTTWGGQLSIISTHRGVNTVFNEILNSISSWSGGHTSTAGIISGLSHFAK